MMNDQLAYLIWGEVATTTLAFKSVSLSIYTELGRVMIPIELRWWARYARFEKLRAHWLKRAEANVRKFLPAGWRALVYYRGTEESGATGGEG